MGFHEYKLRLKPRIYSVSGKWYILYCGNQANNLKAKEWLAHMLKTGRLQSKHQP